MLEKVLQRDPMQWIAGMLGRRWHDHYFVPAAIMANSSDAKSYAIFRAMNRGEWAPSGASPGNRGRGFGLIFLRLLDFFSFAVVSFGHNKLPVDEV